jgi:ribosomal protein RSM22 (predicted rRNA methylase)
VAVQQVGVGKKERRNKKKETKKKKKRNNKEKKEENEKRKKEIKKWVSDFIQFDSSIEFLCFKSVKKTLFVRNGHQGWSVYVPT